LPHGRHEHSHPGDGDGASVDRRLWLSVLLNGGIVVCEIAGGMASGSVALLSDALHNLADVAALVLAIATRRIGRRPPSARHTYGLKRLEVLAAATNAVVLLGITLFIGREAVVRLLDPRPVERSLMLAVAVGALVGNGLSVLLLKPHAHHDLNVRSAFLHLLQDALASLAVVVAALFAHTAVGPYLDPVAALAVGLAVVHSALGILGEATGMLVEGTPRGLDVEALAASVAQAFPPARIHHVHVWEVGPGERTLTAHLSLPEMPVSAAEGLIGRVKEFLAERWDVGHATLEAEVSGCGRPAVLPGCNGERSEVSD